VPARVEASCPRTEHRTPASVVNPFRGGVLIGGRNIGRRAPQPRRHHAPGATHASQHPRENARKVCVRRAGHKGISPLPVALVEGRRRVQWYPQAPPIAWALERLKPLIKSIRSSLNRRLGGVLSTGFTRATLICGKVAVVAWVVANVPDSCACAASDHAAATPTNRLMNSRGFTRSPRRRGRQASAGWRYQELPRHAIHRLSPLPDQICPHSQIQNQTTRYSNQYYPDCNSPQPWHMSVRFMS
jgi:hypothetical protein